MEDLSEWKQTTYGEVISITSDSSANKKVLKKLKSE